MTQATQAIVEHAPSNLAATTIAYLNKVTGEMNGILIGNLGIKGLDAIGAKMAGITGGEIAHNQPSGPQQVGGAARSTGGTQVS